MRGKVSIEVRQTFRFSALPHRKGERAIGRPGLTLIEVLVSIFVMAIGMLALLTLFPLGALRMDAALRDERTAQGATNAQAVAKIFDLRHDPLVISQMVTQPPPNAPGNAPTATVQPDGPGFAVFVDPSNYSNFPLPTPPNSKLATYIARTRATIVNNNAFSPEGSNFFTGTDDVTFQQSLGVAKSFGNSNVLGRESIYTWTYLFQRPKYRNDVLTNGTACVFYRRPLAGPLEVRYQGDIVPNQNSITLKGIFAPGANNATALKTAADIADLVPGAWILDATVVQYTGDQGKKYYWPMAKFYRITGVQGGGNTGQLTLSLQTPITGYEAGSYTDAAGKQVFMPGDPNVASTKIMMLPLLTQRSGGNGAFTFTTTELYVLKGLVEVFDLGPGR
jgi:prepilin-type N-terminal cleavage/methylation domain-containing protein